MNNSPLPINIYSGREIFDNDFGVASSMECTGLIPAAPDSGEEVSSYSEIYDVPLPGEWKQKRKEKIDDYEQWVQSNRPGVPPDYPNE